MNYRELLLEYLVHLPVFELKSTHDVLAADEQVHDASHHLSGCILLGVVTHGKDVYELHEGHELVVALRRAFQELQLKLLLEVRKGLVHVLIPPLHEPRSPDEGGLELVEVPFKHIANFEFCLNYLLGCHGVIR